uniref:Uncharacterized protein n=1 Tax=Esox lucius TaxID=8010 RepID=A0AAY5JXR3_ESOLU
MSSQGAHNHPSLYLEVVGIHVEFLGVQHIQLSVGAFDSMQDRLSMSGDHGVSLDGSRIVQVTKLTEIPLGPGTSENKFSPIGIPSEYQFGFNLFIRS